MGYGINSDLLNRTLRIEQAYLYFKYLDINIFGIVGRVFF